MSVPLIGLLLFQIATADGGARFEVRFPAHLRERPASGRVVVMLAPANSRGEPLDGPSWTDPHPMYGIDAVDWGPDTPLLIDNRATAFGPAPGQLPPGDYKAQARLDLAFENSSWRREAGNLYGPPVAFRIDAGAPAITVPIPLTQIVSPPTWRETTGVELVEVRSKLLSDFRQQEVILRAGVALPLEYDPNRQYSAVYEVPGFGGDHRGARRMARGGVAAWSNAELARLSRDTFWIVLDPESPNGHTLFADSAVNGPCGQALVEELIPELERRYPLISSHTARLLRGHSSGGWSTLWLGLRYPHVFGGVWSSSPDPVDFRRMERVDIYAYPNAYSYPQDVQSDASEIPAVRSGKRVTLTVRQENQQEEIAGSRNRSAQQWDSWQAVWGTSQTDPPGTFSGLRFPRPLFDAASGVIDRQEVEHYRQFDLRLLLQAAPERYAPIFRERIRLICGGADDYFLNEAVEFLKQELDAIPSDPDAADQPGYIKVLPGYDHGSIFGSPELRGFHGEMLQHLEQHGHVNPDQRR